MRIKIAPCLWRARSAFAPRGTQYACRLFQRVIRGFKFRPRMSGKGDCWDDAPTESFFATLKKELIRNLIYITGRPAALRSSVGSKDTTTPSGCIRHWVMNPQLSSRRRQPKGPFPVSIFSGGTPTRRCPNYSNSCSPSAPKPSAVPRRRVPRQNFVRPR